MIQCHLTRAAASIKGVRQLTVSILLTCLLLATESSQDQDQIRANYQVTSTNNQETFKVGNTKTQNYNFHQNSYLPTQLTQVVLNVPKLKKTLRKSRPPTEEEFSIKRRILDVYNEARQEVTSSIMAAVAAAHTNENADGDDADEHDSGHVEGEHSPAVATAQPMLHLDHLGRIIQALNPKYVATERVRRVAFADPADPDGGGASKLAPLPDAQSVPDSLVVQKVELNANEPLPDQLDGLGEKLRELIHWDDKFIESLMISIDEQLSPEQITLKRLLLCLNEPTSCSPPPHPLALTPSAGSADAAVDRIGQQQQVAEHEVDTQQQQQQQQQQHPVQTSQGSTNTPDRYYQDRAGDDRDDQQALVYDDEPAPEGQVYNEQPAAAQEYEQQQQQQQWQRRPDYDHRTNPYLPSLPVEPPARRIERFIQRYPQTGGAISQFPTNFNPATGRNEVGAGITKPPPVFTNSRLNDYRNQFTPTRQPAFTFQRPPQRQTQPQSYQYQDQQWQLKQPAQRPFRRYRN